MGVGAGTLASGIEQKAAAIATATDPRIASRDIFGENKEKDNSNDSASSTTSTTTNNISNTLSSLNEEDRSKFTSAAATSGLGSADITADIDSLKNEDAKNISKELVSNDALYNRFEKQRYTGENKTTNAQEDAGRIAQNTELFSKDEFLHIINRPDDILANELRPEKTDKQYKISLRDQNNAVISFDSSSGEYTINSLVEGGDAGDFQPYTITNTGTAQ